MHLYCVYLVCIGYTMHLYYIYLFDPMQFNACSRHPQLQQIHSHLWDTYTYTYTYTYSYTYNYTYTYTVTYTYTTTHCFAQFFHCV